VLTKSGDRYAFKRVGEPSDIKRMHLPPGFLFLKDVSNGEETIECIGNVISKYNLILNNIIDIF
jgi:hypothetical protein